MAKTNKKPDKTSLEYKAARDAEKVKGIFHYPERPGQVLKFNFEQYGTEPQTKWELQDGQQYELPRGVARHLNNSGFRNVYEWYKDEQGMDRMRLGRKHRRYYWEQLDFFELEDVGAQHDLIQEVKL